MAWFLRAIQTAQGEWECHHGARVFDAHATLEDALEHLRSLASELEGIAEVFVHSLDGQVRRDMET
jgi:hypothetical protein